MKRILVSILALWLMVLMLPIAAAFASDISNAKYNGKIRVTNNGTASSMVSVNFTLNSTTLISNNFANASLTDIAIQYGGYDVAFSPGYGSNPWILNVPIIGAGQNADYDIYTGNATGGKIVYSPAAGGMSTADSVSMEPSYNWKIEDSGYFDTTHNTGTVNGTGVYYLNKQSAIRSRPNPVTDGKIDTLILNTLSDTSGSNGFETIYGSQRFQGQTFTTTGAASIVRVQFQIYRVGNPGTITANVTATAADVPTGATLVSGSFNGNSLTTDVNGDYYSFEINAYALSAATKYAVYLAAPSGDAGNYIAMRYNNGGGTYAGGDRVTTTTGMGGWANAVGDDRMFTIDLAPASISATSIASGEATITTEQKTGVALDGTDDLITYGDPGDGDLDVGTGDFTLEILLAAQRDATERAFVNKGNTTGGSGGFYYLAIDAENRINAYLYNQGATKYLGSISAANYLSDNLTYLLGMAVNRSTNKVDIYVNGVETAYTSDSAITGGFDNTVNINSTRYFTIGGYATAATSADRSILGLPTKGTVYSLRLYKRYISAAEMLAHAQGTYSDNTSLVLATLFKNGTGTALTDSSGNGNTGTSKQGAATAALWYARMRKWSDSTLKTTVDYTIPVAVPDNAYLWYVDQNYAMLYLQRHRQWVNGELVQDIGWQHGATFTDASGKGNTVIPTYRTTSSDADVSAALISFQPIKQARAPSFSLTQLASVLPAASAISELYTELDSSKIPGGNAVDQILDEGEVPRALWWFPFIFIGIAIIGFLIYQATTLIVIKGQVSQESQIDGSLLTMAIIVECLLALAGIMKIIPFWPALLFPIPAIALILSRKHLSWG